MNEVKLVTSSNLVLLRERVDWPQYEALDGAGTDAGSPEVFIAVHAGGDGNEGVSYSWHHSSNKASCIIAPLTRRDYESHDAIGETG